MPKIKNISVDYSDFDEPVNRIEQMLDYYLENKNQEKLRIDEKYIANNPLFQTAITDARQELGIERYNYLDYESPLEDWIAELITGKPIEEIVRYSSQYYDCLDKYRRIAQKTTEKANLPYGWQPWIEVYIAMDQPPQKTVIESDSWQKIEVIGLNDDSIVIRLNKGLKPKEYRNAWKAFSEFLKQPSAYRSYGHLLKHQIYLDRRRGMTYKQLADRYFPDEIDREASEDKIKKIIKRRKSQ